MELKQIGQALDSYVRPATFPVAIKMAGSPAEVPEKARLPKRDLATPMPLCQGIALARRYGWVIAMGSEDMLCPLGSLALGFLLAKPKFLDGSFNIPFWAGSQEVRAKLAQGLPRLEPGKYSHLVAAPLHRADFEAQVIVVYGNTAQIARLIQANVYGTGEPVASSSTGGLACAEEISRTMLTDQCQFIIAGGGDRTVAQTQDHEAAFALPMSKAEALVEGLEETHKRGMRYPTTSFLTYKAEFPPSFSELTDYLKQDS